MLQVGRETPPAKLKLSGAVWSLKHLPGAKLAAGKFKACVGKIVCQQSSEPALQGGQGGPGGRSCLVCRERLRSCLVNTYLDIDPLIDFQYSAKNNRKKNLIYGKLFFKKIQNNLISLVYRCKKPLNILKMEKSLALI